jgi:hypothetical protein
VLLVTYPGTQGVWLTRCQCGNSKGNFCLARAGAGGGGRREGGVPLHLEAQGYAPVPTAQLPQYLVVLDQR